MQETSTTINTWAEETFGNRNALETASRCNLELAELISVVVCKPEATEEIGDEVADVYIVLCQIPGILEFEMPLGLVPQRSNNARDAVLDMNGAMASIMFCLETGDHTHLENTIRDAVIGLHELCNFCSIDLYSHVNKKMATNRARNWKKLSSGRFQHT